MMAVMGQDQAGEEQGQVLEKDKLTPLWTPLITVNPVVLVKQVG